MSANHERTLKQDGVCRTHQTAGRKAAEEIEKGVRLLKSNRPPRHHPHRRATHRTVEYGRKRVRPHCQTLYCSVL